MSARTIEIQTPIMWPKLWFGSGNDGSQGSDAAVYAPDVLFASWTNPQPWAAPDAAAQMNPMLQSDKQPSEVSDFLSRVYANQEC